MQNPGTQPILSIVIPVWNDATGLTRLLYQLQALPQVGQIIISDDGSDLPCNVGAIDLAGIDGDPKLVWLRSETQKGAGHARNIALERIECPYVLFLDSDDLLLPGFQELLDDLTEPDIPPFDFCLFRHVDSRMRARGDLSPLASDQHHWDSIAVPETPTQIFPAQAARICRISAYPWNKVYRTEFLRTQGIHCTEIMVHNDLELHWISFLRAKTILASSRICHEHFVHETGKRLTNRSGKERFEVFAALRAVQADIFADARKAAIYADAVAEFYVNLFRWIEDVLQPELRVAFRHKAQCFLHDELDLPVFTLIATADPALAQRINHFLTETAA